MGERRRPWLDAVVGFDRLELTTMGVYQGGACLDLQGRLERELGRGAWGLTVRTEASGGEAWRRACC